jgi:DNA-binding LacI/PurR family transcriptional regulator
MVATMQRVTLQTIAKSCGFSVSTVSAVLRGEGDSSRIKPATQQEIVKVAESLGYQPNIIARALRSGKTGIVAIAGSPANFPIRQMRQSAVADAITRRGYRAYMFDFSWDRGNERTFLENISAISPEGLIVSEISDNNPRAIEYLLTLKKRGVTVLSLDKITSAPIDQAYIDRFDVGYMAAEYLIKLGHRKICYMLSRKTARGVAADRAHGFEQALTDAGIEVTDDNFMPVENGGNDAAKGYKLIMEGLMSPGKYTAIMTTNDMTAAGIMKGCIKLGIRIPADISLIGAEGLPITDFLPVPLTSIAFPIAQLAETAGDVFVDAFNNGDHQAANIKVDPYLIERSSCRKIR